MVTAVRAATAGLTILAVSFLAMAASGESSGQGSPAPSDPAADGSHPFLSVSAELGDTNLVAAGVIADSFETGVRRVTVRVVDEMELVVRIEASRPLTLDEPLHVCLAGPYWAPDDAGLADRCWGEPDLAEVVAAMMPRREDGLIRLEPGQPIVVSARLRRGGTRCDYPPGLWQLEVASSPPSTPPRPDRVAAAEVPLAVPYANAGPLPLLAPLDARYCGLANAVLREQGEPEVRSPVADPTPTG